jgi:hypothetical protein
MDWKLLFKGDNISAVEFLGKTPTLEIVDVKLCKLQQEDGREKDKGIVHFRETDRGWVLNRTNATCLAAMFGRDTDSWKGKRVTLFAADVQFGKERIPGIRVKGSPDIAEAIEVEVKLPRRRPVKMTMQVTKRAAPVPGKPPAKPAARPPRPPEEEEPPDDLPPAPTEEVIPF